MTEFHKKMKIPFDMTITNYTTHIKSTVYDILYLKNGRTAKTFAAYSQIKRDVANMPIPDIDTKYLRYYQTNFNFREVYADKIYNIDIKSAYATILYNDGYISKKSFDYLSRLPKIERLASVGMLAGRKNIFSYNEQGKLESCSEVVSQNSNYFYYAVKKTYEIMDYCKVILGNDFLFSWVDSVYFARPDKADELREVIQKEFNIQTSFDELLEFDLTTKDDCYKLSYIKDEQHKVFNIPYPVQGIRQNIFNYLLNKEQDFKSPTNINRFKRC